MNKRVDKAKRDRRSEAAAVDVLVGENIRRRRQGAEMTLEPAARMLGISASQLSRYEKGLTSTEPAMLVRMSVLFDCDTCDFLSGVAPESDERRAGKGGMK